MRKEDLPETATFIETKTLEHKDQCIKYSFWILEGNIIVKVEEKRELQSNMDQYMED